MPVSYTHLDVYKRQVLGGFLCHPTIDALIQDVGSKSTIFGLPVVKQAFTIGESTKVFSYTESVIPIILLVIVLALSLIHI